MKKLNFAHISQINQVVMKSKQIGILVLFLSSALLQAQSMEEGLRYLENENYKAALMSFQKGAQLDPKNYMFSFYIGEVFYAQDMPKEAREAYTKGLEISSKCDACEVGLAKLLLDENKVQEAKKHFEAALKGNNKNASVQAWVGSAYLYSKNPDAQSALDYLVKARDLDPKQSKYWIYLGDAYQAKGDLGLSMTSFETAVEKDKKDPETYVKMARIWASSANLDLAIERLESAIQINPNYAIAYKDLYELYIRKKRLDKVVPILERYVELSGSDVDAKVRLVKFLCYQAKDYNRAITEGLKVLETNPDQYTLHRWLAWSYFENGEFGNALKQSQELYKSFESDPVNRKQFASDYEFGGKSALKLKQNELAETYFQKLIELDPGRSKEIMGLLAKAYYDQKEYAKAENWYNKKNEQQALSVTELLYLGLSQRNLMKYIEADTVFGKILEKSPSYEYGWLMRADIRNKMDTSEQKAFLAKPFYEKYIELASANPEKNKAGLIEAYLYMVVYHAQKEAYDTAKSYCEMTLKLDAEESRAKEFMKILVGSGSKPRGK